MLLNLIVLKFATKYHNPLTMDKGIVRAHKLKKKESNLGEPLILSTHLQPIPLIMNF